MTTTSDYQQIRYETPSPGVVRIVLARERKRNAQTFTMLYELDDAFTRAAADDDVRAIILAADGPHFSSGHDQVDRGTADDIDAVGTWFGFELDGIEGMMNWTREAYFDTLWRWRNIPKPTIAQVQGKAIGGGLCLVWICDLVVASDDAQFADPTVRMSANGVEYYGHPWEFGIRKAKELLFTSGWLTAPEALRIGMVNRVLPPDELADATLELAATIAKQPSLGLKLAKVAVNAAQEQQGFYNALREAFMICTVAHAQHKLVGMPADGLGPGFLGADKIGRTAASIERRS